MKGIVTVDDIVDVVQEEATEDIQKIGGSEALDAPYLADRLLRTWCGSAAGWLAVLFLGEMLTATAMGYFEKEIARAVVLALFVPLIISSGGNSGSQADDAGHPRDGARRGALRDWWRVVRREIVDRPRCWAACSALIGLIRILVWQAFVHSLRRALPAGRR